MHLMNELDIDIIVLAILGAGSAESTSHAPCSRGDLAALLNAEQAVE